MDSSNNDGSKRLDRRQALQVLGVTLAAGTLANLAACKPAEKPAAAPPAEAPPAAAAPPPAEKPAEVAAAPAGEKPADGALDCKSAAEIDETAKTMRRSLQYKEKTDNPEKKCSSCAQYLAGKYGNCGGCNLFGGAVNPEGICLSYAPKAAPADAPAAVPAEAPKGG